MCSKEVENRYIIFMFCKSVVANKTIEYGIVLGVIASPAVYKRTQRPQKGFFYQMPLICQFFISFYEQGGTGLIFVFHTGSRIYVGSRYIQSFC